MYTNASQTHHLIALAEFSNSTRFGFRAVERRDRSCSCRGAHVCAPLQAPPGKTRTGDAVNCRGLQQGTGSTFRGVPQLPC